MGLANIVGRVAAIIVAGVLCYFGYKDGYKAGIKHNKKKKALE